MNVLKIWCSNDVVDYVFKSYMALFDFRLNGNSKDIITVNYLLNACVTQFLRYRAL